MDAGIEYLIQDFLTKKSSYEAAERVMLESIDSLQFSDENVQLLARLMSIFKDEKKIFNTMWGKLITLYRDAIVIALNKGKSLSFEEIKDTCGYVATLYNNYLKVSKSRKSGRFESNEIGPLVDRLDELVSIKIDTSAPELELLLPIHYFIVNNYLRARLARTEKSIRRAVVTMDMNVLLEQAKPTHIFYVLSIHKITYTEYKDVGVDVMDRYLEIMSKEIDFNDISLDSLWWVLPDSDYFISKNERVFNAIAKRFADGYQSKDYDERTIARKYLNSKSQQRRARWISQAVKKYLGEH